MTLWDHISRDQRKTMAEMIRPPDEGKPVILEYFISLKTVGEICELMSGRRLDSLLPVAESIKGVIGEEVSLMRIVIEPPATIQSIRVRDMDGKRSFALPRELLDRVANELGLFDGTAPEALPPLGG